MERAVTPKFSSACIVVLILATSAWAQRPTEPVLEASIDSTELAPGQSATVIVSARIPDGFHSQSHTPSQESFIPFKVTMNASPGLEFSAPLYPKGHDITYPALGTLNVYEGTVEVKVPLRVRPDARAGPVTIGGKVSLQMCDDKMCYPPMSPAFSVSATVQGSAVSSTLPAGDAGSSSTSAEPYSGTLSPVSPDGAEEADGAQRFTILGALGAALLAGLLFNIMPCVLPVLPLKAAAFYRAAEHHRSRSIVLGVAFSMGIIAVFAILAVLVLVLRVVSWGSLFSNPWFVWPLVILLVVCAMGLFGAFNITLPTALYGVDPRQDTFGGNVVFGAFTAILATPCTAPLLPPLLIWASAQPGYIGVPAMLLVGVGMALPYLILSAFPEAARKFPQTGPWAELFKQMMGFLLLAAAAYFGGGRVVPGAGFWWLIVAVMAVASLYLVARTVQLSDAARPVAIAATIAVVLLGGSMWWTVRVTGAFAGGAVAGSKGFVEFTDERFADARASGKPVLVKFTANWCGICQVIEGTVFRDPDVWRALDENGVTALKVDFSTSENVPGHDLLLRLNPAGGIPLTAIFPPGSDRPIVLASQYGSDDLLAALQRATNGQARASAD